MALDKRIRVGLEADGMDNDQGEYVPGPITWYDLWAEVRDGGSEDRVEEAGFRTLGRKVFRVRWRLDIVIQPPSQSYVDDEYGQRYNVDEITDNEQRRRFIDLGAVRDG